MYYRRINRNIFFKQSDFPRIVVVRIMVEINEWNNFSTKTSLILSELQSYVHDVARVKSGYKTSCHIYAASFPGVCL